MAQPASSIRAGSPRPLTQISSSCSSPISSASNTSSSPRSAAGSDSSLATSPSSSAGLDATEPKLPHIVFLNISSCLQCQVVGIRCSFNRRSWELGRCCCRCRRIGHSLCAIQGTNVEGSGPVAKIGDFKSVNPEVDKQELVRGVEELLDGRQKARHRKNWALPVWETDDKLRMKKARQRRRRLWGNDWKDEDDSDYESNDESVEIEQKGEQMSELKESEIDGTNELEKVIHRKGGTSNENLKGKKSGICWRELGLEDYGARDEYPDFDFHETYLA